jgi:hypothetical protein
MIPFPSIDEKMEKKRTTKTLLLKGIPPSGEVWDERPDSIGLGQGKYKEMTLLLDGAQGGIVLARAIAKSLQ